MRDPAPSDIFASVSSREKYAALAGRIPPGILPSMPDDALRKLFPMLTDDELRLAEEHLDQYLALAWEIMLDAEANLDHPRIPGQDSKGGKVEQHT